MLADRVATTQCRTFHAAKKPEWDDLTPRRSPRPGRSRAFPGSRSATARADARFGHPAGARPAVGAAALPGHRRPRSLWSLDPGEYDGGPGVGHVRYPGQLVDVWVVDVEGTPVVVYAELSPGLPDAYRRARPRAAARLDQAEPIGE